MRKKLFVVVFCAVFVAVISAGSALAIFTNGGFEQNDFSGWTTGYGQNYGLSGAQPFTEASIVIQPGGTELLSIAGVGASDPITDNLLQLPREGSFTATVNDASDDYHLNWISQQGTITQADRDPNDNQLHVRFRYAAVLEDAGHSPNEQPFFHVIVKNVSNATTLFDDFTVADEIGKPFVASVSNPGWLWMDWQSVDIVIPDSDLNDTLEIRVTAADCAQGGHGGYVYLDGFGSAPPPPQGSTVVPTMTEWGMIIFVVLAGLVSVYYMRKQRV